MRTIEIVLLVLLAKGVALKMIRDAVRDQRSKARIERILDAQSQRVGRPATRVRPDRPLSGAEARWEAMRRR